MGAGAREPQKEHHRQNPSPRSQKSGGLSRREMLQIGAPVGLGTPPDAGAGLDSREQSPATPTGATTVRELPDPPRLASEEAGNALRFFYADAIIRSSIAFWRYEKFPGLRQS